MVTHRTHFFLNFYKDFIRKQNKKCINLHREEQYKSLWSELETFVQGAANSSPMHRKVYNKTI